MVEGEEGVEVEVIGPRNEEGHLLGRVDAALGDAEELDELVLGRQTQLEAGRAEADLPEGVDVHRSRSGWPSMLSSAMSRRKNSAVVQSTTTRSFRVNNGSWYRW